MRARYADLRELYVSEKLVVWTDCSFGGGRAGAGVFYGNANPLNRGLPVDGEQTSQRAELTAIAYLLANEQRQLEIRTDSRYVERGVAVWRHEWRRRAWYHKPARALYIPNADLWHDIDRMLGARGEQNVVIVKVKAHASIEDVKVGLAEEIDVWGNCGADCVAKLAQRCTDGLPILAAHVWHG